MLEKKVWARLRVNGGLLGAVLCLAGGAMAQAAIDQVVRVGTPQGYFDIQLLPGSTPNTVTNFLNYRAKPTNGYNGTFIHRSAPGFVIQGGGRITSTFTDNGTTLSASHIPTDPPIANEFHLSNVRGTVAMAKVAGNPDSATSEWFVNLADNSANLDNSNGGFTVFGRVISGMSVVDAIAALPRIRTTGEGVPVYNYSGTGPTTQANLVTTGMVILTGGKADFSGDVKPDILWQNNSTREGSIWIMNGTTHAGNISLGIPPPNWIIAGSGDFNRDGKPDILWQNTVTGERSIWLMNGPTHTGNVSLGVVPLAWTASSVGDMNGDGFVDILWENSSTHERSIWIMNGTVRTRSVTLGTVAAEWSIAATGDMNGDAQTDIIWQNSVTNERSVWIMNQTSRVRSVSLGVSPAAWKIVGAGDYNGDGKTDIIWQNNMTREGSIWLMNGTTRSGVVSLGIPPPQWVIRTR